MNEVHRGPWVSAMSDLFLTKGLSPQLSPKTVESHTVVLKLVAGHVGGIHLAGYSIPRSARCGPFDRVV